MIKTSLKLPPEFVLDIVIQPQAALLTEIVYLREKAWRSAGFYLQKHNWSEETDMDQNFSHFLIKTSEKIVAGARLSIHKSLDSVQDGHYYLPFENEFIFPMASLTRLFVDPEYQHHGVGTYLHHKTLRTAEEKGAKCCGCDIRSTQTAIAEKFGYIKLGQTGAQEGWPPDWDWTVMLKKF